MQLKLIQQYINDYKWYLSTSNAQQHLYIWESQAIFQENWDLEANDFKLMYDKSLQNSKTRRLWNRENYAPKAMLLKFMDLQPGYVRQMFSDLFNEEKEIEGRISRFVFYCDQLLQEYKATYPHRIENNHDHDDDYQMISIYLSFQYPEKYTLYNKNSFIQLLEKIGAKNISPANDFARFVKVIRTLNTFLRKDEALLGLHQARFIDGSFFNADSWLLVYDFYSFVGKSRK